jgi:hypothetical protein
MYYKSTITTPVISSIINMLVKRMYYKPIITTPFISSIVKILVKRQCRKHLPAILEWINEITTYYKQNAPYTSELNISRLSDYYPQQLLQNTQVAIVKRCPLPPLAKFGIKGMSVYETWEPKGVQYKDMYFVRKDLKHWNVVHFHELVHTIQWQILKDKAYMDLYGTGIIEKGYRQSPLEEMAWRLQQSFEYNQTPFDVSNIVRMELEPHLKTG